MSGKLRVLPLGGLRLPMVEADAREREAVRRMLVAQSLLGHVNA